MQNTAVPDLVYLPSHLLSYLILAKLLILSRNPGRPAALAFLPALKNCSIQTITIAQKRDRCNNCQRRGRSSLRTRSAMSDLPPKWSEAKDADSGDTYFWNTDTNETSWDRPVAPPTAGPAPPPPPPRRREQMATSCDDPEQLLLNPPDPNLICPICLKLFTQPVRTACGCARRL